MLQPFKTTLDGTWWHVQEKSWCITEVRHRWCGDPVGELRCWQPEAETLSPNLAILSNSFPFLHFRISTIALLALLALRESTWHWPKSLADDQLIRVACGTTCWLHSFVAVCGSMLTYIIILSLKNEPCMHVCLRRHISIDVGSVLFPSISINMKALLWTSVLLCYPAYGIFDRSSKCFIWRCLQQKQVFTKNTFLSLSMCFGFPCVSFQLVHFAREDTCREELHNCTIHLCHAPRSNRFLHDEWIMNP